MPLLRDCGFCRIRSEPFYASHPAMRDSVIDACWEGPTHVTGLVSLGSLRTLERGSVRGLAQQGFRHVVLLCDAALVRLPLPPIPPLIHRSQILRSAHLPGLLPLHWGALRQILHLCCMEYESGRGPVRSFVSRALIVTRGLTVGGRLAAGWGAQQQGPRAPEPAVHGPSPAGVHGGLLHRRHQLPAAAHQVTEEPGVDQKRRLSPF